MTDRRKSSPIFRQLALNIGDMDDQIVPRKARAKPKTAAKAGAPKKRRVTPAQSPKPAADTDEP